MPLPTNIPSTAALNNDQPPYSPNFTDVPVYSSQLLEHWNTVKVKLLLFPFYKQGQGGEGTPFCVLGGIIWVSKSSDVIKAHVCLNSVL